MNGRTRLATAFIPLSSNKIARDTGTTISKPRTSASSRRLPLPVSWCSSSSNRLAYSVVVKVVVVTPPATAAFGFAPILRACVKPWRPAWK